LIDKIKPMLDPFNGRFKPIHPTMNTYNGLFNGRCSNLQILNVLYQAINFYVDPP
jgi:hypothetical protein